MHLWQIAWVRDLVWIAGLALILLGAYATRAIVVPILVGLALAYVFNPFVTYMQQRRRWPRAATTAALLTVGFGAVTVAAVAAVPGIADQSGLLYEKLGDYAKVLIDKLGPQFAARFEDAPQQLAELDFATVRDFFINTLDVGVSVVGSAFSFVGYLVLSVIIVTLCFFFFSWHFEPILAWFGSFIPKSERPRVLHVLGRMDRSISAFIRGRLVQSLIMTVLLSAGWYFVGVPFWLLLGVFTGVLNLVPYAGVVGFLAAVTLAGVDHLAGGQAFTWWVLVGPAGVYIAAQAIDGWVVEPLVQGKATDLDPLTILLVVLLGGSLAGLLGLILAIPLAACVKILAQEVILPRLRATRS